MPLNICSKIIEKDEKNTCVFVEICFLTLMTTKNAEEHDHIASMQEAVDEWRFNVCAPADQAWLLHDYDVWVKNPHYVGPPVPHPEDEAFYDSVGHTPQPPAPIEPPPETPEDDIPF